MPIKKKRCTVCRSIAYLHIFLSVNRICLLYPARFSRPEFSTFWFQFCIFITLPNHVCPLTSYCDNTGYWNNPSKSADCYQIKNTGAVIHYVCAKLHRYKFARKIDRAIAVLCALCSVLCALCSVLCALCSVLCASVAHSHSRVKPFP